MAFTQGLAYEDGVLYEGTGLRGHSVLLKRQLEDGKLIKRERLPRKYFGEGITLFGEKVVQLTWKSRTGFVYDKKTFRALDEFKYSDQGWGITYDGKRFVMSDGTPTLRILDPNTFAVTGRIHVEHQGRNVRGLNELEFIDGKIYANIWPTEYIAIITPETGEVTGWLNLTGLCPVPEPRPSNIVLNGIAYMPESKHLLVTGKCWPKLYEIEMVPLAAK
jgi:glutamine cyclotransferase